MTMLHASDLDGRNIGSVIGISVGGVKTFATLEVIKKSQHTPDKVQLFVGNMEQPLNVDAHHFVDVFLSPVAKFLSHMNNDLQDIRDMVAVGQREMEVPC